MATIRAHLRPSSLTRLARPTRLFLFALILASTGCPSPETTGQAEESPDQASDSAVRRAREAVSESNLPGAGALGRALDASDEAAARSARMDSLMEGR